ncbi:DUF1853 family protein [Aureispira anguillae]|uniref:DUF1853 family protein n=1 Tax=Aureispira anguillae TaxID=2864201 RepID=A0A915YC72_9BACT|nr:DUF1853 family protein [Aureispira anguillae]BDS10369.1 DUF1853 family protein [Aureispira anguillae]
MQNLDYLQQLHYQYQGFLAGQDINQTSSSKHYLPFMVQKKSSPTMDTLKQWAQQISPKLVLGKRVEHFMSYYLSSQSPFKILAQNVQIFEQKTTIGELDFLLEHQTNKTLIHLEQVYKFYLYVPNSKKKSIDNWIGPNCKDRFQQKINKLHQKQFPLLYHPNTQKTFHDLNLDYSKIQQQLSFKAALFVPLNWTKGSFSSINHNCIEGHWLRFEDWKKMPLLKHQFYLPQKQNWGVFPSANTTWYSYEVIESQILTALSQKRSPLCWMKIGEDQYRKFFVVWW